MRKDRTRHFAACGLAFPGRSDVEAEECHVAVVHDIVLALGADEALLLSGGHAAAGFQVVERDDLGADEAALKVRVDLTGGLRRLRAACDRPGAALIAAARQERNEPQQAIRALDKPVKAGLFNAELFEEHRALIRLELADLLLDLGADGQHLRALRRGQIAHLLVILTVLVPGGERVLVEVGSVNNRLDAQQVARLEQGAVLVAARIGAGALAVVEVLEQTAEHIRLVQAGLVAALAGLGRLVDAALDHLDVRHNELEVDDLNVAQRVGRALDVHDVFVVKAAHDVHDRIRGADVGQELVAEALALGRALDEAGDVDKLDHRGGLFLRLIHLSQIVQPRVRHGDHADVRVDGAKRVVGDFRARVRDGVEQRGLADVRQADDT